MRLNITCPNYGPARDRRDCAGRTVAAPQGGGRARSAPGSSVGAGGADRPQPPANARCSGHRLLLGGGIKK